MPLRRSRRGMLRSHSSVVPTVRISSERNPVISISTGDSYRRRIRCCVSFGADRATVPSQRKPIKRCSTRSSLKRLRHTPRPCRDATHRSSRKSEQVEEMHIGLGNRLVVARSCSTLAQLASCHDLRARDVFVHIYETAEMRAGRGNLCSSAASRASKTRQMLELAPLSGSARPAILGAQQAGRRPATHAVCPGPDLSDIARSAALHAGGSLRSLAA